MSEEKMIADLSGVLDETEEDWRLDDSLQVISSESDDIESFGEQAEITVTVEEEINEEQPQDPGDEENFLHLAAVLEGLLFLTGDEGMTARQAEETLGTGSEYTARLFDYLQQYYNADERGIELARFGETWRFLS